MRRTTRNSRQRGAALIIGLILLAIITLLAVVGMNIANSELASATSEQIRLRAFQAAETGLEHGLKVMKDVATVDGRVVTSEAPVPVAGSPEDSEGNPLDTFTLTTTYRGESPVEGYGANFRAFNYSILSQGASSRNAVANNEQGAYVVNSTGGQPSFGALPE